MIMHFKARSVVAAWRSNSGSKMGAGACARQRERKSSTTALAISGLLLCFAPPLEAQDNAFGLVRTTPVQGAASKAGVTTSTPAFDILSCPFDIFRDAYLGAFSAPDRLAVMALEDEALAACAKRQERVNVILSQERKLRDLLITPAPEDDAVTAERRARANETGEGQDAAQAAPQSAQTSDQSNPLERESAEDLAEGAKQSVAEIEAAAAALNAPNAGCERSYMVEASGHQYRGDGKFHWASLRNELGEEFVVKAGDALPGDWKISSVSREVVLVISPDGETEQLPVAPTQGGNVIDANFYYTITPMGDVVEAQPSEEASE